MEQQCQMPYYVYMILCENNSFYTGYTGNLNSRMTLHVNGKGARYTRMYKPKKLVYAETFGSRKEAIRREKAVKRLTHRRKLELANSYNKQKRKKTRSTKGNYASEHT